MWLNWSNGVLCVACLNFWRAMLYISAAYAAMRCLSVRPSVCQSRPWILSKRVIVSSDFFTIGEQNHSSFCIPTLWRYSDGDSVNEGFECRDSVLLNRLRIGHTRLTHSFLLSGGDLPECGTCQCPPTVKHILVECVDLKGVRNKHCASSLKIYLIILRRIRSLILLKKAFL